LNILALDSSDAVLSVALATKTGFFYMEIKALSHSELLLECTQSLCKSANISPSELNMVSCMNGPGSFTGLRIGFSSAKGIALALGIPLVSVPTLDCLAHPFSMWPGIVLPVIDAKKGCFFAAFYRHGKRLTCYRDSSPEALAEEAAKVIDFPNEPILLTGGGAELLHSSFISCFPSGNIRVESACKHGSAKELLEIAKSDKFEVVNDINSGPAYLRKSNAELNFKADGLL